MVTIDEGWLRDHPLPPFQADGDKEARGRVVVVGGSSGTLGAVLLAGRAALAAGAGKLRLVAPSDGAARTIAGLSIALPEARIFAWSQLRLALQESAAAVLGPGLLSGTVARQQLDDCVGFPHPLVLDALALRLATPPWFAARQGATVITPHLAELMHLTGESQQQLCADRAATAVRVARQLGCTVIFKGSASWISDGESCWESSVGDVGLATSGSGDVLAGLVGGLLARGSDPLRAACWGVELHARAGRLLGPPGYLAGELAARVPGLMRTLEPSSDAPR